MENKDKNGKKTEKINFRKFQTSSEKLVWAGKNAENNEDLIKQVEDDEIVLHTSAPGSPFVNIKGKANKIDIKESAVFCAFYSQAWKKAKTKKDVQVDYFLGKDIMKVRGMKTGTFGVKKSKKIIIKKAEIEKMEKGAKLN
jgi:predicted ribosome quality control (RQC) complex YloA/Tae2 family protein